MNARGKYKALLLAASLTLSAIAAVVVWADAKEGFDYTGYAEVLEKYVDENGMVNYKELKNNRSKLDTFVDALEKLSSDTYRKWSEKERIAFWTNAYNAITLRAIIDHYPIKASKLGSLRYPKNSIRQIPGVWTKLKFPIKGDSWTLDEIEHTALRGWYNEPRIHLALVCAANSCPPLRKEPYYADRLDQQFDDQTRKFIALRNNFRLSRKQNKVYLSSIFKWFGKDFVKTYGADEGFPKQNRAEKAVLNYLTGFLDDSDSKYLRNRKYAVKYTDYDWSLNEQ